MIIEKMGLRSNNLVHTYMTFTDNLIFFRSAFHLVYIDILNDTSCQPQPSLISNLYFTKYGDTW